MALHRQGTGSAGGNDFGGSFDDARDARVVLTGETLEGVYGVLSERDGTALHAAKRSYVTR